MNLVKHFEETKMYKNLHQLSEGLILKKSIKKKRKEEEEKK